MALRRIVIFGLTACGRLSFDPVDVEPGPTLVQSGGSAAFGVAELSATLPSAPTPGNVLVLVGAGHDGTLVSTLGAAGQWQRAASSTTHPNIEIWYGVADGSGETITISSGQTTGQTMWIGEWSGLDATDVLDAATAASGETSPAIAGTITTSTAPTLVLFAVNDYLPNTYGQPTGGVWTELDTQSIDSIQRVWSMMLTAPGDLAPGVDETQHRWDAAIAALRVAR